MRIPLLRTKLHRPQVARDHLHRQHLLDRINRHRHQPLILISAPAGYGKSTLASCWVALCDMPNAWLSLDDGDNDIRLFLSYFLAAIRSMFPHIGNETLNYLESVSLPPAEELTRILINELDQIDDDFVLVLDDYHLINEKFVHDLLSAILSYPPVAMHLVVATRRDPSFALSKLRARGQIIEVRVQDLRFSAKEVELFFRQVLGIAVDAHMAATLEKKTEGWAAGLRLAALSLQEHANLEQIFKSLPENNRYVMDFIVDEVLSHQPPEIRQYLLMTAILNRFCAPLCRAICAAEKQMEFCLIDAEEFIDRLVQTNLFVIPLDDRSRWYRYHHLFQQLLMRQLKRKCSPEQIEKLHKQAGLWFAENGLIEEAFYHLRQSNDITAAAELITRHRHELMNQEQWHMLSRYLQQLPVEVVENKPELLTLKAWIYENQYRYDQMLDILQKIRETAASNPGWITPGSSLQGEIDALTSAQHYLEGDGLRNVDRAKAAINLLDPKTLSARGFAEVLLAFGYQSTGDLAGAYRLFRSRLNKPAIKGTTYHFRLLAGLCFVQWIAADLNALRQTAKQYLDLSVQFNLPESITYARHFKAVAHYCADELSAAEKELDKVVKNKHIVNLQTYAHSAFLLSLTHQHLGRADQARSTAEEVVSFAMESHNAALMQLSQSFAAELALRQNHIDEATQWAQTFEPQPFPPGFRFYFPPLTLAKVLMAKNNTEGYLQTEKLLSRLLDFFKSSHNTCFQIQVLCLQALLHDARKKEVEAMSSLHRAVEMARPNRFERLFADLGPKMGVLLRRLAKKGVAGNYVGQLLEGFENGGKADRQPPVTDHPIPSSLTAARKLAQSLTRREIEILKLLAPGLVNKEIASDLFISPETVKKHTQSIYRKLKVSNRQQAVAQAYELGILSKD